MKQKAITISLIKNNNIEDNAGEQRMTSLEIAELTGKQHKDVLKAVRNMEPAWTNVTGRKFALSLVDRPKESTSPQTAQSGR